MRKLEVRSVVALIRFGWELDGASVPEALAHASVVAKQRGTRRGPASRAGFTGRRDRGADQHGVHRVGHLRAAQQYGGRSEIEPVGGDANATHRTNVSRRSGPAPHPLRGGHRDRNDDRRTLLVLRARLMTRAAVEPNSSR
jgi:hypothetical protein